jgi:hypothetical protein
MREMMIAPAFATFLFALFFGTENGGSTFLRSVGNFYRTARRHVAEDSTFQVVCLVLYEKRLQYLSCLSK